MSKNLKVSNLGRTYGIHSQLWTLLAQIAFIFLYNLFANSCRFCSIFFRYESLLGPQALGWKILCSNFGISGTWLTQSHIIRRAFRMTSSRCCPSASTTWQGRHWWLNNAGGLDMLRAWDPKFLPFWVWNHQHHQLEACDLDSGAHLELWFVPVGPLCCVQSMLWISIPSWRAYKIHGILLIFFLCSSLPRGEVWCPLEWRKTGHQELQGLLWSLLAFLGMFKTFKTWISKHHLLKQLHLMIMVRPFSNKVASWAYSYIMLYQLYSP
jgi:hypothetical protein